MPMKLIVFVAIGLVASSVLAQVGSSTVTLGEGSERVEFKEKLAGQQIPRYMVAAQFFRTAANLREAATRGYELFLGKFGVEPETKWDEIVEEAILAAMPILERKTVDFSLADDEAAFMSHQAWAEDEKARDLAYVYRKFLADLRKADYPMGRWNKVLNEEVRANMSILMTDPESDRAALHRVAAAFDEEMSNQ